MEPKNIINRMKDNQCSRCGDCCGLFVPFTDKELHIIKEYVKKHNIQPVKRITENGFEARCCFYDKENKKCNIYEVRPFVCRDFRCDRKDWKHKRDLYEKHGKYNSTKHKKIIATFDDMIYGDYEPLLRYLLHLSSDDGEQPDHHKLIELIKSVNRLDVLDQFKAYDNDGNEYTGRQLLDVK